MLEALCARPLAPSESSPVVLMVSGGSDSTALLVRAVRGRLDLADGMGERALDPASLCVLHVNHCLRGADADADQAFVEELARNLGVACRVERIDVPALGGNFEEKARIARYQAAWELAGELACAAGVPRESARILVAHTADDQAETFLMRATTGAGASGMSGLRRARGIVVRPLLENTRAELREYLAEQGIGWCEDATNAQTDALRSFMRARVVPLLEQRNPRVRQTLAASLEVLAQEDDLLERLAADALAEMRRPAPAQTCALDAAALVAADPALARRALRQALRNLLGEQGWQRARLELRHLEAILACARGACGPVTLPLGVDVRLGCGVLTIAPCAEGLPEATLPVPGSLTWGDVRIEARLVEVGADEDPLALARARSGQSALADARACGVGPQVGSLIVGCARPGERMRPLGLGHDKLVADVLADARVPAAHRARVPIVRASYPGAAGQEPPGVMWVGGIRLDERAACGPSSHLLIELRIVRLVF